MQIYSQANLGDLPEYQLISKNGPDHSPVFEVQLTLSDGKLIVGKGKSKSLAENDAAEKMLISINHDSIDWCLVPGKS